MQYVLVYCESFTKQQDVLLVLKDKPKWQQGRLNLPGGKIEDGETPEEAAERELKEETGYEPLVPLRKMGLMIDGSSDIHCFKAVVDYNKPVAPRDEETQQIAWHDWLVVRSDWRLIPNLQAIIPLMRCGVSGWVISDNYRSGGGELHTINLSLVNYHPSKD
jgi:8-oxo-dGTP pyrophosphatase MutT (NUDIX family)